MQEGSNQFNQIYEVLRQYQNKLINMQEEGNHQFNQIYLETIKKFLEAENKCYEKVDSLNKEFEGETTRLTNSHTSNLQDLQKKKDIEISGLHDRALELAKKANDLVVLAKQSEEGATNYLVSERKRTFCKSARTIFYLPIDNFNI